MSEEEVEEYRRQLDGVKVRCALRFVWGGWLTH